MFDLGCDREAAGCQATWPVWVRRAAVAGHAPAIEMARAHDGHAAEWYWSDLPAACSGPLYQQAQELEASGTAFDAGRAYRRAAERGNAHAAYRLGRLLRRHDRDEDIDWLSRASSEGHLFAAVLLDEFDRLSYDTVAQVRSLAEAGDLDAAYAIGVHDRDAGWLRDAARAGDADAAVALGKLFRGPAARHWMRRAALAGHPEAEPGETAPVRPVDLPSLREQWQEQAVFGDADAHFNLGADAMLAGDPAAAERSFLAAADLGDLESVARIAALRAGSGLMAEAEAMVRDHVESDVSAACVFGALRFAGDELEAAWDLWQSRASAGHVESAYHLALLHEADENVPEAQQWYQKAADAGHLLAARRHGDLILARLSWDEPRPYWELLRRQGSHAIPAWAADDADLVAYYRFAHSPPDTHGKDDDDQDDDDQDDDQDDYYDDYEPAPADEMSSAQQQSSIGLATAWMAPGPPSVVSAPPSEPPSMVDTVTSAHSQFLDWLHDRGVHIVVALGVTFVITLFASIAVMSDRAPGGAATGVVLLGASTTALVMATATWIVDRLRIDQRSTHDWSWDWDWDWDDAGIGAAGHGLWLVVVWIGAALVDPAGQVGPWIYLSLPFLAVPYVAWSRFLLTALLPVLAVATALAPMVILGSAMAVAGIP